MEIADELAPSRIDPLDLSALEQVLGGPLLGPNGKIDPAVLDRFSDHFIYAGLLAGIAARLTKRKLMTDGLQPGNAPGGGITQEKLRARIDRTTAKLHRDAAVFIHTVNLLHAAGAGQ